MAVTEESRYEVHKYFEETMGRERATTLMELLPPVGWGDVATKQDVALVKQDVADLKQDVADLKQDVAELKQDVVATKQDVAELKQDVALVKQDVAELKQDVTELKQDVVATKQDVARLREWAGERFATKDDVHKLYINLHKEIRAQTFILLTALPAVASLVTALMR